jgi:hypothetical protein
MSDPNTEVMLAANINHLGWLETYSAQPELQIAGIDLLKCFTYDLVQVLNHAWLKEQLNDTTS